MIWGLSLQLEIVIMSVCAYFVSLCWTRCTLWLSLRTWVSLSGSKVKCLTQQIKKEPTKESKTQSRSLRLKTVRVSANSLVHFKFLRTDNYFTYNPPGGVNMKRWWNSWKKFGKRKWVFCNPICPLHRED